jgi:hypothetical protein
VLPPLPARLDLDYNEILSRVLIFLNHGGCFNSLSRDQIKRFSNRLVPHDLSRRLSDAKYLTTIDGRQTADAKSIAESSDRETVPQKEALKGHRAGGESSGAKGRRKRSKLWPW